MLAQALIVGVMNNVMMGYSLSVLNTALPALSNDFGWCSQASGYRRVVCPEATIAHGQLNSALIWGSVLGSLLAAKLLDALGRRKSIASMFIGFALVSTAASAARTFNTFWCLRLLTGVLCGLSTVIPPVYLQEVAPARLANITGILPAVATNFGVLFGILIGLPLVQPTLGPYLTTVSDIEWNSTWWRRMIFVPGILSAICLCLLFTSLHFEPPGYLRKLGRAASEVENSLWGKDCCSAASAPVITEDAKEQIVVTNSISLGQALRTKRYLSILVTCWIVSIGQQLSGMTAIIGSSNNIFLQAGLPGSWLSLLSALMAGLQLAASACCVLVTSRYQPAVLVAVGSFAMGCTMALIPLSSAFGPYWLKGPVASLSVIFFALLYGISYGPGLLLYLLDSLPQELRERGLSVGFALNWLGAVAAIHITANLSQAVTFTIFSIVCLSITLIIQGPPRQIRKLMRLVQQRLPSKPMEDEGGASIPLETPSSTNMKTYKLEQTPTLAV